MPLVLKNVLDMSPKEYKDYIMETLKSDQEAFNTYKESNQVSVKAAKIRDLGYLYNCYSHLFEFNMMRRSASRRQSSTPNVQPQVQLPPLPLTPDFYAFPEELPVNDLVSVVSSAYKIFINRLKFAQMTENRRMPGTYEIIGMLEERGAEVPPAVKEAARAQSEMQNNPDQEKAEQILNDKYGTVVKDFWTENQAPIREVINTWQYNLRDSFLKSTFNVEKGFAMDIMKCQDQVQALKSSFEPFPEDVLNSFDEMFGLNNSRIISAKAFRGNYD